MKNIEIRERKKIRGKDIGQMIVGELHQNLLKATIIVQISLFKQKD